MDGTCDWNNYNDHSQPNQNVIDGAIVGDCCSDSWEDKRWRADVNQPYIEQNAGWQGAIAGIVYLT